MLKTTLTGIMLPLLLLLAAVRTIPRPGKKKSAKSRPRLLKLIATSGGQWMSIGPANDAEPRRKIEMETLRFALARSFPLS
jgi:hypothetical protein